MKNISLIMVSLLAVCIYQPATAQFGYYNDALLFSQTNFGGSARMQGIGGAQVALGGDLSSTVSNPAGLGFFNRNTVVIGPQLNFNDVNASFQDTDISNYGNYFNLGQIGGAFHYGKGQYTRDKFKGGTMAISMTRVNDFNNEIRYEGENFNNSIIDSFLESADRFDPVDLGGYTRAAYESYLINPIYEDGDLVGYGSDVGGFPLQNENILSWGGQTQFQLAWGGNYDDRVYFGGGIGFQTVNYNQERNFEEWDFIFNDGSPDEIIDKIWIKDMLTISGTGFNANFGLILRPMPFMTVGASYTSPTFFNLEERYKFNMTTEWSPDYAYIEADSSATAPGFQEYRSDLFVSDYSLRTPAKLNVGTAIFLGKNGFITGDVEFVNYRDAQLKSQDFTVTGDNQEIDNLYTSVINYRLGGELRFDQLRFRGGYAFTDDPFKGKQEIEIGTLSGDPQVVDLDRSRESYSFGAGFRTKDYFVDLSYVHTRFKSYYNPYSISFSQPLAQVKNEQNTVNLTFGFIF